MIAKGTESLKYSGEVTIKLKQKDSTIVISKHNQGLDSLFKMFAMALMGQDVSVMRPIKIDLRGSNSSNHTSSSSCLSIPILLSGSQYYKDESIGTWVSEFTATIPYSAQLSSNISKYNNFWVYLMAQRYDLACLAVDKADLSIISPGSQYIVEWRLAIYNS